MFSTVTELYGTQVTNSQQLVIIAAIWCIQ